MPTSFITGASSGIGAELARTLSARGHRVGLLARRADRLEALADELGDGAAWATADVADDDGFVHALDELAASLGEPDIVVANAGYGQPETPQKFRPGRAIELYDVNLLGALRLIDWALPRFLERGSGHVVGIASVASYFGLPHFAAYSGSKAALRVHLQSLRISMPKGLAFTTICPGFVKSELTAQHRGPMPFLVSTERAARRIADAIERRQAEVIFPWQMKLVFTIARRLPRAWLEAGLRRMG